MPFEFQYLGPSTYMQLAKAAGAAQQLAAERERQWQDKRLLLQQEFIKQTQEENFTHQLSLEKVRQEFIRERDIQNLADKKALVDYERQLRFQDQASLLEFERKRAELQRDLTLGTAVAYADALASKSLEYEQRRVDDRFAAIQEHQQFVRELLERKDLPPDEKVRQLEQLQYNLKAKLDQIDETYDLMSDYLTVSLGGAALFGRRRGAAVVGGGAEGGAGTAGAAREPSITQAVAAAKFLRDYKFKNGKWYYTPPEGKAREANPAEVQMIQLLGNRLFGNLAQKPVNQFVKAGGAWYWADERGQLLEVDADTARLLSEVEQVPPEQMDKIKPITKTDEQGRHLASYDGGKTWIIMGPREVAPALKPEEIEDFVAQHQTLTSDQVAQIGNIQTTLGGKIRPMLTTDDRGNRLASYDNGQTWIVLGRHEPAPVLTPEEVDQFAAKHRVIGQQRPTPATEQPKLKEGQPMISMLDTGEHIVSYDGKVWQVLPPTEPARTLKPEEVKQWKSQMATTKTTYRTAKYRTNKEGDILVSYDDGKTWHKLILGPANR